jgi:hypothetical protein
MSVSTEISLCMEMKKLAISKPPDKPKIYRTLNMDLKHSDNKYENYATDTAEKSVFTIEAYQRIVIGQDVVANGFRMKQLNIYKADKVIERIVVVEE